MDVQDIIKGQNRKYLYIFFGIVVTAVVLWYLFKDAAKAVTQSAEVNVNATDYDPASLKSQINAKYSLLLAAATSETEKATLIVERDAELENVDRTAALQAEYYALFKSYPKSNMTADMIQDEIDLKNQEDYDIAVADYKAKTKTDPPSSCKTAAQVYAALDSYNASAAKKAANAAAQATWEKKLSTLDVEGTIAYASSALQKWGSNKNGSGPIWSAANRFISLYGQDKAAFVYATNLFVSTCPKQWNNNAKLYANGMQQFELISNKKTSISNTDTQNLCGNAAQKMQQVTANKLTVDNYGNILVNGKTTTDSGKYFESFSGKPFFRV